MANFGTQVKSLTGIDTNNSTIQGYINTWLTDGVKEIQNVLPPDKLEECTNVSVLNGSSATLNYYTATIGKIVSVNRNNGSGYYQVCRKVPVSHSTRVTDSSDIMNYATTTDPVYWMNNNTLSVFPTPTTSGGEANVYYVYMPAVVYTDSQISHFLTEAEYLVVNYASIKSLSYLMNQISNDELDLVTDFADANNWLNTEEDNEMVSSRLSVIGAQINDFNTKRGDQDRLYKWYKDQYALLKQDYAMGLKMLVQGSPEPAQEGARG